MVVPAGGATVKPAGGARAAVASSAAIASARRSMCRVRRCGAGSSPSVAPTASWKALSAGAIPAGRGAATSLGAAAMSAGAIPAGATRGVLAGAARRNQSSCGRTTA
eukprot:scaffold30762_cov90-Isochrysis_galbana.AAC.1